MAAITIVGTSRLGAEPRCRSCGAGATMSFNWAYLNKRANYEDNARIALFAVWRTLRRGVLYRCGVCQQCWHLDGDRKTMTHVADERLRLVLDWDRECIRLSDELVSVLKAIGPTPPDLY